METAPKPMNLFSQRTGLKPASKAIQRESIDEETRNGLWSILWNAYELYYKETYGSYGRVRPYEQELEKLADSYWAEYFKNPTDTQPGFGELVKQLRTYFFTAAWNEVLDFLEFTTKAVPEGLGKTLRQSFNSVLEKESAAYRFAGETITELTSATEITAIDTAIDGTSHDVSAHLKKALHFLSDRKKPDYHNSIKESVSAIEAAAREASGEKSATLTDALKALNKQQPLHPALSKMLFDLYGYAGDEGGVRHANKETSKPVSQAEARLILVISAAACSYLSAKRKE